MIKHGVGPYSTHLKGYGGRPDLGAHCDTPRGLDAQGCHNITEQNLLSAKSVLYYRRWGGQRAPCAGAVGVAYPPFPSATLPRCQPAHQATQAPHTCPRSRSFYRRILQQSNWLVSREGLHRAAQQRLCVCLRAGAAGSPLEFILTCSHCPYRLVVHKQAIGPQNPAWLGFAAAKKAMTRLKFQGVVPYPPEDKVDDWGLTPEQQVGGPCGACGARQVQRALLRRLRQYPWLRHSPAGSAVSCCEQAAWQLLPALDRKPAALGASAGVATALTRLTRSVPSPRKPAPRPRATPTAVTCAPRC